MIRYPVTQAKLEAAVDATQPTWRQRAQYRTQAFRTAGKYEEPPAPFWSEIKSVYMRLQHDKCAYCERQLGAEGRGQIEHDIEHFRPKNAVRAWPQANRNVPLTYPFSTGDNFPEGYYLLAYHLFNYAAACKPCNTICKSNYFPIAGSRSSGQDNPYNLADEQPLLIYPLGDLDEDPEELIRFDGHVPVPVSHDISSYTYQRARVTIDMFGLVESEELIRERSERIVGLFLALRNAENGLLENARFAQVLLSSSSPHTNCLRCFARLFAQHRTKAEVLALQALRYLEAVCS